MGHLQHLKWPMAVRRPFILNLYGVSGVLIEYYAHNFRYFDFRPFETLILVILRLFLPLGPKIQEMGHLQHLKWPMAVRTPFILSLYGVAGVLIEYSTHNCSYLDFRHSETLILVILGYFVTLRTKNPRNGPSATPQFAYGSYNTFYTEYIWSFRGSN